MNPVNNTIMAKNNGSAEICRMSWFLIEIAEETKRASDRPDFCIIHSVDLIDGDSSNMYVNRLVRFNLKQAVVAGKVLLASDDRQFVEQQLQMLTQSAAEGEARDEPDAIVPLDEKHFLVQYTKGPNNIVHAVVQQKDICWPVCDLTNQREVLIRDGKIQRLAAVLYQQEQEEQVRTEMEKLKTRCFDMAFDDSDEETEMRGSPWLLVQYSCSPANVVYAIINYSETVWQAENLYKDVMAFLSDGSTIYQAIIIRKSDNRSELDNELRKIKEHCLTSQFPAVEDAEVETIATNKSQCAKGLPVDRSEKSDTDLEHLNAKGTLEEMEQQMQREASMIASAFEVIDRTRKIMEKRLFILNNT